LPSRFERQKLFLVKKNQNGVLARPQPDVLPSVFAPLRRDRAEAEGGQEKEPHSPVLILRMTVRQIQSQVFQRADVRFSFSLGRRPG
jgi:hypothetical protein